ncbi:MAG: hypothetical protein C0467_31800 [Planctomycetaceae bacterium]|nr:hypothetical protein [Planctomycetaceae bacterium]
MPDMKRFVIAVVAVIATCGQMLSADIPPGPEGFKSRVAPFFKEHCVTCHGPEKNKGKITLHAIDGDISTGREVERWEQILKALKSGEMPPEDRKQPDEAQRKEMVEWIEVGLRDSIAKSGMVVTVPTARRLTNFEYQNTMRDLLGFKLNLIKNLPEDPVKPYKFNNTAEYMLLGPEQLDRYLENARRAMASAIVDPGVPKIHKSEMKWQARATDVGLGSNELGVYGNRRGTPATGMGVKSWPTTGEYRVRVKASAILPPGTTELPLRLVMGYNLNQNLAMLQMEPVGTAYLRNDKEHSQVFEFRGRIENYPVEPGIVGKDGKPGPPSLHITPQNLYDDGTLNDDLSFQKPRNVLLPRAVIDSIEFEAPLVDVWPPEHHTRILFDSPLRKSDPKAYVREVLKRFISRAYRRPATEEDVNHFAKIYAIVSDKLETLEAAMRETLSMVLISPQFLCHTVSEDNSLRQYELASKLSYFLWGSMPDDELMRLAAQNRLDDPAVIETQVRRLLADPRSRDFIDNFTTQWVSIDKLKSVKINTALFPRFLYLVPAGERKGTEEPYRPTIRDYMHDETVAFVAELIRRNAGVSNVVDSDFACLNVPLAAHYGVEGVTGHELRPVAIKPEHHLGGLLTHGSVLVGNSTGSAPHPIYRAVWLREAILGEEVKPPPAEVPALSDTAGDAAEKAVSIKDLLRKHRQNESCNACHARLDPWGIPFEQYNAIGKYQPKVPAASVKMVRGFDKKIDMDLAGYSTYLNRINTVPVQADSEVPRGPKIDGMEQLKAFLLKDRIDDIGENVLRRLLTYGIGRELTYRDRVEIEKLHQQSKQNNYKLQDMIVTICQSPTFRDFQTKPKGK